MSYNDTQKRKAELDKLEVELKSKIDKLNNVKKDEHIQMLERANELDSVREEMEKALQEFERLKREKLKAKDSLKQIESSRNCESTLDLDTRFDVENTDPNIETTVNKFYDSTANVIFQSPVPGDDFSDEEIQSNEVILNRKETPNVFAKYKRSFSRGGNRSSQLMNPLTESYECQTNHATIKPRKKSKNRNSYRYMNSSSQNLLKNIKVPTTSDPINHPLQMSDHQKSTKMLIDCLMKQLNPVTAYMSDFTLKSKRKPKESERSRNDISSSMFLELQEKAKTAHNNHLAYMSNSRASNLNFSSK